jgi:hypothetical protein
MAAGFHGAPEDSNPETADNRADLLDVSLRCSKPLYFKGSRRDVVLRHYCSIPDVAR